MADGEEFLGAVRLEKEMGGVLRMMGVGGVPEIELEVHVYLKLWRWIIGRPKLIIFSVG